MKENAKSLLHSMEKRGGGVRHFELIQINELEQYFQIRIGFETCDSMGANFINSCLESFSHTLEHFIESQSSWTLEERDINILMSILSNYTPECIVRVSATCPVDDFSEISDGMSASEFAERFYRAIQIAKIDPYRAVTHNKGIFNGIDSVVIATGNDFRAIEACGHAYASRDGAYRSLSDCSIINNVFTFWLDIPLALGTIGGLTELHPIAKRSLELLGNPSAEELMQVTAATGLAQNFAAIKSLITTGIQQGHMKMHLGNILNHLKASPKEINLATAHFQNQKISFTDVRLFIEQMRSNN
jgi:hydroxymethylglutaryl-CoA reductase